MQPELSSEIRNLYQVLFETRHKLEFVNQIYKLRASLIDELLHPQFSTSTCSSDKLVTTKLSSNSTLLKEEKLNSLPEKCLTKSVPSLADNEPVTAAQDVFDFTQLDLLIQKAKKVRNVGEPPKLKKEDSNKNSNKECSKKDKPSSGVSKRTQPVLKHRIPSSVSTATPKSTYQSSYSKKPFLQQKRRAFKTQSCSLPPIRFEERDTADQELLQPQIAPRELLDPASLSEDTQHSSPPNDTTTRLPSNRTDNKEVPFSFPPPYAPPVLPPDLAEALRDLRRAQVELARLLRTDHTKLLSPGKELINEFDNLNRGEETAEDRLQYAYKLYSEIEAGSIPSEVKSFFLNSLYPHLSANTEASRSHTGFVYPCFHCTDPSACSTDGIQVPRSFLLRELNLCSLLSHCYPRSLLSHSSLINKERLQCVDLNQFLELQLLIIDVFSLSVKKDVLGTCMKVVPALDLDRPEDRQALKIIVSILDSSKLISFFNFTEV